MTDPIVFVHKQPALRNIGDELCSPKHYFSLRTALPRLAIVGGGVFGDFGAKALRTLGLTPAQSVLWGIGRSAKRDGERLERIATLPHLAWGLRDIDGLADAAHFLPCVSCLHPMLDAPIEGDATLLFVNAETRVTPTTQQQALARLASERGWTLLHNDCSDAAMAEALRRHRRVVTNSFHGAYWSLLSGHETAVVGYSTKFHSLLLGLGLDPSRLQRYDKPRKIGWLGRWTRSGRGDALVDAVLQAAQPAASLGLPDAGAVLGRFRRINLDFAASLVQQQILTHAQPRLPG